MFDPYGGGNYGYAIPGYQYMNIQQPMYAQQYGQPPIFHQYGYVQQNNNNTNNKNGASQSYYPSNNYSQQQQQYDSTQRTAIPSLSSLDNHENTTQ